MGVKFLRLRFLIVFSGIENGAQNLVHKWVNLYADGTETIGAHSDSEEGLSRDGSVAAISLGAERVFRVKRKATAETLVDVRTKHGQLLVMEKHAFQRECTHEVPVQKKIHGPRVSITFRQHVEK